MVKKRDRREFKRGLPPVKKRSYGVAVVMCLKRLKESGFNVYTNMLNQMHFVELPSRPTPAPGHYWVDWGCEQQPRYWNVHAMFLSNADIPEENFHQFADLGKHMTDRWIALMDELEFDVEALLMECGCLMCVVMKINNKILDDVVQADMERMQSLLRSLQRQYRNDRMLERLRIDMVRDHTTPSTSMAEMDQTPSQSTRSRSHRSPSICTNDGTPEPDCGSRPGPARVFVEKCKRFVRKKLRQERGSIEQEAQAVVSSENPNITVNLDDERIGQILRNALMDFVQPALEEVSAKVDNITNEVKCLKVGQTQLTAKTTQLERKQTIANSTLDDFYRSIQSFAADGDENRLPSSNFPCGSDGSAGPPSGRRSAPGGMGSMVSAEAAAVSSSRPVVNVYAASNSGTPPPDITIANDGSNHALAAQQQMQAQGQVQNTFIVVTSPCPTPGRYYDNTPPPGVDDGFHYDGGSRGGVIITEISTPPQSEPCVNDCQTENDEPKCSATSDGALECSEQSADSPDSGVAVVFGDEGESQVQSPSEPEFTPTILYSMTSPLDLRKPRPCSNSEASTGLDSALESGSSVDTPGAAVDAVPIGSALSSAVTISGSVVPLSNSGPPVPVSTSGVCIGRSADPSFSSVAIGGPVDARVVQVVTSVRASEGSTPVNPRGFVPVAQRRSPFERNGPFVGYLGGPRHGKVEGLKPAICRGCNDPKPTDQADCGVCAGQFHEACLNAIGICQKCHESGRDLINRANFILAKGSTVPQREADFCRGCASASPTNETQCANCKHPMHLEHVDETGLCQFCADERQNAPTRAVQQDAQQGQTKCSEMRGSTSTASGEGQKSSHRRLKFSTGRGRVLETDSDFEDFFAGQNSIYDNTEAPSDPKFLRTTDEQGLTKSVPRGRVSSCTMPGPGSKTKVQPTIMPKPDPQILVRPPIMPAPAALALVRPPVMPQPAAKRRVRPPILPILPKPAEKAIRIKPNVAFLEMPKLNKSVTALAEAAKPDHPPETAKKVVSKPTLEKKKPSRRRRTSIPRVIHNHTAETCSPSAIPGVADKFEPAFTVGSYRISCRKYYEAVGLKEGGEKFLDASRDDGKQAHWCRKSMMLFFTLDELDNTQLQDLCAEKMAAFLEFYRSFFPQSSKMTPVSDRFPAMSKSLVMLLTKKIRERRNRAQCKPENGLVVAKRRSPRPVGMRGVVMRKGYTQLMRAVNARASPKSVEAPDESCDAPESASGDHFSDRHRGPNTSPEEAESDTVMSANSPSLLCAATEPRKSSKALGRLDFSTDPDDPIFIKESAPWE